MFLDPSRGPSPTLPDEENEADKENNVTIQEFDSTFTKLEKDTSGKHFIILWFQT